MPITYYADVLSRIYTARQCDQRTGDCRTVGGVPVRRVAGRNPMARKHLVHEAARILLLAEVGAANPPRGLWVTGGESMPLWMHAVGMPDELLALQDYLREIGKDNLADALPGFCAYRDAVRRRLTASMS